MRILLQKILASLSAVAALIQATPVSAQADNPYALKLLEPTNAANPAPMVLGVNPGTPAALPTVLVPPPKDCKADEAQITSDFKTLRNANAGWQGQYGSFISYLPCNREVRLIAATQMSGGPGDPTAPVVVWGNTNTPFGTFQVRRMNSLTSAGANSAFAPDPARRNFIGIPVAGQTAFVPEEIAWSAEASFINGLVTRLMLAKIKAAAGVSDPIPVAPPPAWAFNLQAYVVSTSWQAGDYKKALQSTLASNPIQADAIFAGWKFAEDVEATNNPNVETAVLRLLSHRLTTRQLGEAVGYTLSYLQGYAESEAAATTQVNSEILSRLQGVLLDQAGSLVPVATFDPRTLNDKFFTTVTVALYNPGSQKDRDYLKDFLIGYNQGSIRSAEVIFADVFLLGYGKGYSDGFRDGYSTGFAEGVKQTQDAQRKSFFGQLTGFVDKVVGVVKSVGPIVAGVAQVVGVIGSIFG